MYRDHDVTVKCCCNTLCFTRHTCRAPHLTATAAVALVGFLYSKHNKYRVAQSDDWVESSLRSSAGSIKRPGTRPVTNCAFSKQRLNMRKKDQGTWKCHLSHQDGLDRLCFLAVKSRWKQLQAFNCQGKQQKHLVNLICSILNSSHKLSRNIFCTFSLFALRVYFLKIKK